MRDRGWGDDGECTLVFEGLFLTVQLGAVLFNVISSAKRDICMFSIYQCGVMDQFTQ